jgi:hypothetical protein
MLPQENLGPVYDKALEGLGSWMPIELVKECSVCGEVKGLEKFSFNKTTHDGHQCSCKECQCKEKKDYYQNPEVKARTKEYNKKPEVQARHKKRQQTPEAKARAKEHLQIPGARIRQKEYQRGYSQTSKAKAQKEVYRGKPEVKARAKALSQTPEAKDRRNKRQRERYAGDSLYRLMKNLRNRFRGALKAAGVIKSQRTKDLLSVPLETIWIHLEKQFRFPMTRENHGKVWHIDHIRPICSFDLSDPKQVKACFHYTNLQPLFVEENLKKGRKY